VAVVLTKIFSKNLNQFLSEFPFKVLFGQWEKCTKLRFWMLSLIRIFFSTKQQTWTFDYLCWIFIFCCCSRHCKEVESLMVIETCVWLWFVWRWTRTRAVPICSLLAAKKVLVHLLCLFILCSLGFFVFETVVHLCLVA